MTQQTFNVSENARVEIRNCHNRVSVIGWDDAQRVGVDYAARQEGDTVVIENADRVMARVPRGAAIFIAECEADVRIEDLDGRVELSHVGGDVSLRNLRGEVLARDLDGELAGRDLASLKGEGTWDGDVALSNVKSFQATQVEGDLVINNVESVSVDNVEGDTVAKGAKSLKGAGTWDGDTVMRGVESADINEIEGDANLSEMGAAKIQSIEGDLTAFGIRDLLAIDRVKGDVNLRQLGGNVSLERVHGDFIASDVQGAMNVMDVEGDAVVSFAKIAPLDLRAEGDVVLNFPEKADADIELDAPHGDLVAHADIQTTEEDERHVRGTLGNGGIKIRAESTKGDLILRAGGAGRHFGHAPVNPREFADMGQRIAREVRESMRDSMRDSIRESVRGARGMMRPKIKIEKHFGRHHRHDHEDRVEEIRDEEKKPRGPAAGSPERQAILDAIARGELNVDDAIKKLRGER